MKRKTILHIDISNADGVIGSFELTQDAKGQFRVDDDPISALEARQLWAFLAPGIPEGPEDSCKAEIRKALNV
jgi:hypothetical protein